MGTSLKIYEPIVIHTRIFKADDDRWHFRIEWWIGNVDVTRTPPYGSFDSKISWVQRRAAVSAAARFAAGIGGRQA